MREFKYKGATVRPYEPFHEHYSESFFSGSIGGGGGYRQLSALISTT